MFIPNSISPGNYNFQLFKLFIMKKLLVFAAFLPVILFIGTANSQPMLSNSSQQIFNWYETVDTSFSNAASADKKAVLNAKAVKIIKRSYRNISEENWFQLETGYMVKFIKDNIPTKVYFNKKGNWIGTIRKMNEKEVPKDIRGMIKSNFSEYKINLFQEITVDIHIVYISYLENEEGFKNVRICDGEMDIMNEFKK